VAGHGTAIRRLIVAALHDLAVREKREREDREAREQPQTEDEFGWSDRAVADVMAEEPWESDAAPVAGPTARLRASDQTSTK
jgi:hypothetical protein